jgi:hypothetical protein
VGINQGAKRPTHSGPKFGVGRQARQHVGSCCAGGRRAERPEVALMPAAIEVQRGSSLTEQYDVVLYCSRRQPG